MWGHMGVWGGWGMGLSMLLFWGLLIFAIVMLVKGPWGFGTRGKRDKSALDILKERYARGEIERDEFEHKKRDLQS